ncbi:hypothetical protein [Waltera sp.]
MAGVDQRERSANYTRENGRKPESVEQALAWQRDVISSREAAG